jgi:hypothetical protein
VQQQYINANQEKWSNDKGVTMNELIGTFSDALGWLSYGKDTAMPWSMDLARMLGEYLQARATSTRWLAR